MKANWLEFTKSPLAAKQVPYMAGSGDFARTHHPGWLSRLVRTGSLRIAAQGSQQCNRSACMENAKLFAEFLAGQCKTMPAGENPRAAGRLLALESQVAELRLIVDNLCFQLGVTP